MSLLFRLHPLDTPIQGIRALRRNLAPVNEQTKPIRTALIDDDPDIIDLLKINLSGDPRFELAGEGSNGAQALEVLAEAEPDVVILDLDMPYFNGLEAITHIRKGWPDVKIVVFSARYDKYDADDLLSNRADLYIDKSRGVPELLDEIVRLNKEA